MSRCVTVKMWRLTFLAFLAMCPAMGAGAEAGEFITSPWDDPFDGSRVDGIAAAIDRIPEGRLRVQFGPGVSVTRGVLIKES